MDLVEDQLVQLESNLVIFTLASELVVLTLCTSLLQALELNGQDLLGRQVKLDLAKERAPTLQLAGINFFHP